MVSKQAMDMYALCVFIMKLSLRNIDARTKCNHAPWINGNYMQHATMYQTPVVVPPMPHTCQYYALAKLNYCQFSRIWFNQLFAYYYSQLGKGQGVDEASWTMRLWSFVRLPTNVWVTDNARRIVMLNFNWNRRTVREAAKYSAVEKGGFGSFWNCNHALWCMWLWLTYEIRYDVDDDMKLGSSCMLKCAYIEFEISAYVWGAREQSNLGILVISI